MGFLLSQKRLAVLYRRHPFVRRVELLQRFSQKRSCPILCRLQLAALDWDFALSPRWRRILFRQPAAAFSRLRMTCLQVIANRSGNDVAKSTRRNVLPKVTLPLNTLQVNTAYSLLRTLRLFCCENPGVLDTTSALVQLPPVGDAQSPYQVPPPPPVWPVPPDCGIFDHVYKD